MSVEQDIAKIIEQEKTLRFEGFSEEAAWQLGTTLRSLAEKRKLTLVIDIRMGNQPLFYTALAGTTPENPDWVRRKVNTVMRFHASSYRIGLQYAQSGKAFDQSRGLNVFDFANAGGGFPLHVKSAGVIGAITVSGAPQRQDHEFVVEGICNHLGLNYAAIALGPEQA